MKKIILAILALSSLLMAQNYVPYENLKPIASYSSSAYNLANGIKYLEVRSYNIATPSGKEPIIGQKCDIITVAKSTKANRKTKKIPTHIYTNSRYEYIRHMCYEWL